MAVDYPKMQYVRVTLEKIKDIQMQLEGSDQRNFIFICTKMYIDTAPERNPGASSSLHAEPSTLVGPDTAINCWTKFTSRAEAIACGFGDDSFNG